MAKVNKKRAAKRAKQKQADVSQQANQQPANHLIEQVRIRLTGCLENTTPLHIGTGSLKVKDLGHATEENADDKSMPVLQIMRDHQGRPYIPGSSLRGLIRYHAAKAKENNGWSESLFQRIFGVPRPKKDEPNTKDNAVQMGMLTVLDAPIHGKKPDVTERARVSIDPVTNTAKANHLFALETVPEGTEFAVTLELERVGEQALTTEEMASLANLLEDMNQAGDLLLGKGKSIGQGTFKWTPDNGRVIERISQKDLLSWISGTADVTLFKDLWKPDNLPSRSSNKGKQKKQSEQDYQSDWLTIPLSIFPQSAFLINANIEKPKAGDQEAAAVFQKNRYGQAEIPGSSLKGLFRAHCRKILLTLCDDEKIADKLIDQIFGSTGQASQVRVKSALSHHSVNTVEQYFNAIDRLTGGVKDTALYHVEAAYCQQLKGDLQIHKEFFEDHPWAQALLAMLMRDAMEEDLSIGWGKSKGFGQTRFNWYIPNQNTDESTWVQSWAQLYVHWSDLGLLNSTDFESLPNQLQQVISDTAKEEA